MRLNLFIANSTGISRRAADRLISAGNVKVNGHPATAGQQVTEADEIVSEGRKITAATQQTTIMLNKPPGYICSRDGQGGHTIYELLPPTLHHLKPIGRLDKHSSGLLLLTTDGQLAYELTHPKFNKIKKYKISLNQALNPKHKEMITVQGVLLHDGVSKLSLIPINNSGIDWQVTMHEGRNRQIRRTFEELGYNVIKLHRIQFGEYKLDNLGAGKIRTIT